MEKQLYEALRKFLAEQGIKTEHSHCANGRILETENEIGLMIFAEVYDQIDGTHDVVPLFDLEETIKNWRNRD
jgi:ligand-binding sensor domain-containing protein